MISQALIVFARYPRLGEVKTRLTHPLFSSEPLEAPQALTLYHCFLEDLLKRLEQMPGLQVWVRLDRATDAECHTFAQEFSLLQAQVTPVPQGISDFGELMEICFTEAWEAGFAKTLLIGSDVPALSEERLKAGFQALETHPMVLGPDTGGGFYLVGYRQPLGLMKHGIPWSQGQDFQALLERCQASAIPLALLPCERDLDTTEDLKAWFYETQSPPERQALIAKLAPRTGQWLKDWAKEAGLG